MGWQTGDLDCPFHSKAADLSCSQPNHDPLFTITCGLTPFLTLPVPYTVTLALTLALALALTLTLALSITSILTLNFTLTLTLILTPRLNLTQRYLPHALA